MNSETIKKVTNEAINQLADALNSGDSKMLTRYLAAMAKFRTYSLLNVLLILKQCPNARRVAGYRTWQSLGRQVRQGQKGIMIFAPIFRKRRESVSDADTPDAASNVVAYRAVYVWDEQQTSGKDLPEIGRVTGDPRVYLARLEAFVLASGTELNYSSGIAPARGLAEKGKVTLLPDLTPAETFATLAHEQAHIILHQSQRRTDTTKRIRETEAEAVAFVVCKAIGLDTSTAAQDYVALYGGDAKLLLESLDHVQQTASQILDGIELDSQQRAA
ncbi:MAG TPA: ArdC-like ssDNA-binding domain-containing protein [Edaphobacter sp.]|uniref:ArdC-like ssDNA-binding domain-containing protein n=1 Tax=Edaphobacter sp. TaxID=1934404 RepID=UPI002B868AE0|nr:ArdC-like ssDNA-binding domain-containing protein [Edaphobacter sp.]HUZ96092.1 ArdC-like ssDNA-binding domain-containing protein [Edaphobacter sp.]